MLDSLWARLLESVSHKVPPAAFDSWLRPCRLLAVEGDHLRIGAPNPFSRDWLAQHHLDALQHAAQEVVGGHPRVTVVVDEAATTESAPAVTSPRGGGAGTVEGLNPRYTFDTFVVGSSNQFAQAACQAVAELPARSYNPLFIYGGVGLGKTHLLHAIGHLTQKLYPQLSLRYVTTEEFTNDFINSIRHGSQEAFKRAYRHHDVLLVDDIQFLERKEGIQEEFFHTFNSLRERGAQIVITSDCPPKSLGTLEDRLRTRFEWGLITDIQPPDFETRMAILRYKSESSAHPMPDEVLSYIAHRVEDNIRELEGALTRIRAYATLYQRPVTVQLADEVLGTLLPATGPQRHALDPGSIVGACAQHFGLSS